MRLNGATDPDLPTMKVSIVIPTLNEASRIAEVVERTRQLGPSEIIVVDGQSTDETCRYSGAADKVLVSSPGRAVQQNVGAAEASGDVLLFLHADCRLAPDCLHSIGDCLGDDRFVGGCFQQHIDAPGLMYRVVERGNSLRVRVLKWAYGDQGIFVRRSVFEDLGGFPSVNLMEDLLFMKRLKKCGRIGLLPHTIHTSSRRWEQRGVVRQTLRNWWLIGLVHLGVSPDRLARFYPHVR